MSKKLLVAMQSGGGWYDNSNNFIGMQTAKECGLEAIDLNIDHVIKVDNFLNGKSFPRCDLDEKEFVETYREVKEASEKFDIAISQAHAPYPIYIENNPKATDYLLKLVEKILAVCEFLGCPELVVHPHNTIYPKKDFNNANDLEINLDMYRKLIPSALKHNVKVCLENLLAVDEDGNIIGGICANPDDACYLIDTLNKEAGKNIFGLCFDVGHANACGVKIREYINKVGKRITSLHIHDNDGKSDAHLIPYSQVCDQWGVELGLDWEAFILGLKDIGYQGSIAFESFRFTRHLPSECRKDAIRLIASIGKYFRKRITE